MEKRLGRANIRTIEDLWNISPKHARKIWGSVSGERFWYNLRGFEVPDLETSTSLIGHSRVLDPALRPPEQAKAVARRLTSKAATRMRRKEFYAKRFSLSVRCTDGRRWGAETQFPPSQDSFAFLAALDELWASMMCDLMPDQLKKLSVTLHSLCRKEQITPDLFDASSQSHQHQTQKNTALTAAIDALNKKHGAETVQLGPSPKTRAGYLGTKIAFSRIPDQAEFCE